MRDTYNYLKNLRKKDNKKYEFLVNWNREKTVNLLIDFLNEKLNCKYLFTIIEDVNGNSADAIVLENSKIFSNNIEGHDLLNFDVEQLIDARYTENDGEIIILDVNGAQKNIDIMYLLETISSKYISYSKGLRRCLEDFLSFLVEKKLEIDG